MSTESINYHPAAPEDLGAIALVLERANAQRDGLPLPDSIESYSALKDLEEHMTRPDAWTHVATDGDRVVGFTLGYPYREVAGSLTSSNTEYLSLLMVEPGYWGRHIASELLDLAAVRARSAGKQLLTLWTREANNAHTRSVYEHKGYIATGQTRVSEEHGPQVQYLLNL